MNIIMIMTDQMHKYAMGCVRDYVLTPNIDKLAEQGFLFENAYSPNPICGPFRGNLFTGTYTSDNRVFLNGDPLPGDMQSLAGAFNNKGYETSFVGKWHLGGEGNRPIPEELRGGFRHFIGYQCYNGFYRDVCFYDEDNREHRYERHRTNVTTDLAVERLHMLAAAQKPFLHVIFYQAPHYPVQPAPEFEKLYENTTFPLPGNYIETDPYTPTFSPPSPKPFNLCPDYRKYGNDIQAYLRLYYGMVSQIDSGVGRIMNALKELNLEEDTAIVFSSDHGDMQGCHGLKNKNIPYEESCGVPMVLYVPSLKGGKRFSAPVSSIDLFPTCLGLADMGGGAVAIGIADGCSCKTGSKEEFEGINLLSLVSGCRTGNQPESGGQAGPEQERCVFAEGTCYAEKWVMLRNTRYKLAVKVEGRKPWLLFDMEKDPLEMNNLVSEDAYKSVVDSMLEQILGWSAKRRVPPL